MEQQCPAVQAADQGGIDPSLGKIKARQVAPYNLSAFSCATRLFDMGHLLHLVAQMFIAVHVGLRFFSECQGGLHQRRSHHG